MQEDEARWALFCLLMVKMAADDTVSASCLFEGDMPGASLQGQNNTHHRRDSRGNPAKGLKIKAQLHVAKR